MKPLTKDRASVYLIAKTDLNTPGLEKFLDDINRPGWTPDTQVSSSEVLAEFAGRLCYRAWSAFDSTNPSGTNQNLSRIRTSNSLYLKNILKQKHGSVLEHCSATFLLKDVSRRLTHELVRHRAGTAFSQESLRYVMSPVIPFWMPESIRDNPKAVEIVNRYLNLMAESVESLLIELNLEGQESFKVKKALTSVLTRLFPIGTATSILVTANIRAWRHIISVRTSPGAEEEIRSVVGNIARILATNFPNFFQDMEEQEDGTFIFKYDKV